MIHLGTRSSGTCGGAALQAAFNSPCTRLPAAFEQTLKDSLTTLTIGGAKGGSDFDPKGAKALLLLRTPSRLPF